VDNECTLHLPVLAIRLPTIVKFGADLTKFWQKQVGSLLAHPVYQISSAQFSSVTLPCTRFI